MALYVISGIKFVASSVDEAYQMYFDTLAKKA